LESRPRFGTGEAALGHPESSGPNRSAICVFLFATDRDLERSRPRRNKRPPGLAQTAGCPRYSGNPPSATSMASKYGTEPDIRGQMSSAASISSPVRPVSPTTRCSDAHIYGHRATTRQCPVLGLIQNDAMF
jgi:hypothetical protein